jgi:hypothetical protein
LLEVITNLVTQALNHNFAVILQQNCHEPRQKSYHYFDTLKSLAVADSDFIICCIMGNYRSVKIILRQFLNLAEWVDASAWFKIQLSTGAK